ncbi:MAG: xanthan lyase [Rhodothermales bacterium]|nr:xanthan lyase [Rhodothermales bacterium]
MLTTIVQIGRSPFPRFSVVVAGVFISACSGSRVPAPVSQDEGVSFAAHSWLDAAVDLESPFRLPLGTGIDTIRFLDARVEIEFSRELARYPFRPESASQLESEVRRRVSPYLMGRDLELYSMGVPIRQLVPNVFRPPGAAVDSARLARTEARPAPLVTPLDRAVSPTRGLADRYVAMWHSHGWYYDHTADRWMWQRPRVFQTVEDLLPLSFTLPYVGPMLEKAGAHVFFARERDPQRNMVVVDNDDPGAGGRIVFSDSSAWLAGTGPGFSIGEIPYAGGLNPFSTGSFLQIAGDADESAWLQWIPDIPETGDYAVYVSYASLDDSIDDADYAVYHAGGRTRFRVNQRIGGSTWIYLGTFRFDAGSNASGGSVRLSNRSETPDGLVSADAVRFGGGMGLIARGGRPGKRPRFMEGARYHLQYSGMPDSLVFDLNGGEDDYRDDYQSRGEWVNYLRGSPFGPNRDRRAAGLGIPVDVSLAFHTDAGITGPDSTIGTLSIYSVYGADSTRAFPDGVSRFANRDLADIVQTEIVHDLRVLYDSTWRRRSLYDGQYSESFRPNVPSMLLELLSHQNFWDMRYALDPRFRFDASRAIYKGILKFLAQHHGFSYVVQPLPVTHFQARSDGPSSVVLSWRPTVDPMEPTATPDRFVVYTRVDSAGFDNGRLVSETSVRIEGLEAESVYSFRVTAANSGGEGFESETLSVYTGSAGSRKVLIINGFDRVAAPASLTAGSLTGFADFWDQGVPDRRDLGYTGSQFSFDSRLPWIDDDAPGHGASHGDFDTRVLAGNTFDYPYLHGDAIRAAGFSFDSASDESVEAGLVDLSSYDVVDLILGEEKTTYWPRSGREPEFEALPSAMRARLSDYAHGGGALFVSGAFIGTDLFSAKHDSAGHRVFADSVLHIKWITDHAARLGGVHLSNATFAERVFRFRFNTELGEAVYAVESPDGLGPVGEGASVLMRYDENNLGAGVGYHGQHRAVTLGFPFETVNYRADRRHLMRLVLDFLSR